MRGKLRRSLMSIRFLRTNRTGCRLDRARSVFGFCCVLGLSVAGDVGHSIARDFRLRMMPNGFAFSCANCHISPFGGGTRTPFGEHVLQLVGGGGSIPFWGPQLASQDSDGDGVTNGQELGDPDGDGIPSPGAEVSNPGDSGSKPANRPPTIQITQPSSGTRVTQPASVTIQALASDSDGTIAKVEFLVGSSVASTLTGAPYNFVFASSSVAPGTYRLSARATDNAGAATTSAIIEMMVAEPANVSPTVQLTLPSAGALFRPPTEIQVTASASDSDGTVTKVEFLLGDNVASASTSPPYSYTFSAASVPAGTYSLRARVTDNRGATATSPAVEITIAEPINVPPTVQITQPSAGAVFRQPAEVQIAASASDSDGTVVKVEFLVGESVLSVSTNSPHTYTFASAARAPGIYSLRARATDNRGAIATSPALEITIDEPVNVPPTVQITQPAAAAVFRPPAEIRIEASANDPDGTIAKVDFFSGTNLVSTSTNATHSYVIAAALVPPGIYSFTARATDNRGATAQSPAVEIIVEEAINIPPTAQILRPISGTRYVQPDSLTIEALVADADGSVTKAEFLAGTNLVFVITNGIFTHTFSSSTLPPGQYPLTVRVTDDRGAAVISVPVDVIIAAASPVLLTGISRSADSVTVGWTGGAGPFLVQESSLLSPVSWINLMATAARNLDSVPTRNAGFFRVVDMGRHQPILFSVLLSGSAERPDPANASATGAGVLQLDGNILTVNIRYSGLSDAATAAHIHGPATSKEAAPVLIDLGPLNGGSFGIGGTISGWLALTPEQMAQLLNARTYVNFHTPAHPNGEIRGQIAPALLQISLSGSNERPAPIANSPTTGSGGFLLSGGQLTFNLTYSGLTGPATSVHLHGPATADQTAAVLIDLSQFSNGPLSVSGALSGTLPLSPDQAAVLADGLAYVNFHTEQHFEGELRGQVLHALTSTPFRAALNGASERPNPVNSAGTGRGFFRLNGNQLAFDIEYRGLSGVALGAHIHGPANINESADVLFDLAPFNGGAFGNSGAIAGVLTLTEEQREMVLAGRTYLNLHSAQNPGGEIRGQIMSVALQLLP